MLNSLDLLVLAFMVLASVGMLALCTMFLVRKTWAKKIGFYITIVLGIYTAYIGIRIGGVFFPGQMYVGIAVALLCAGALVLQLFSKGNEKKFRLAANMAAVSLVVGLINAIS